ncbi:MAG: hypothetical protein IKX30_04930, partial [Victivallales bacterium]|nr:hypothetical protein [Victivallales bacterium]
CSHHFRMLSQPFERKVIRTTEINFLKWRKNRRKGVYYKFDYQGASRHARVIRFQAGRHHQV